jgi:hypothetical protein
MTSFCDAFQQLRENLDQAHRDRTQTIQQVRADVKSQAEHAASTLAEQARARRADFHAFMHGLQQNVQGQAAQTRAWLAELSADLHRGGSIFQGRRSTSQGRRSAK